MTSAPSGCEPARVVGDDEGRRALIAAQIRHSVRRSALHAVAHLLLLVAENVAVDLLALLAQVLQRLNKLAVRKGGVTWGLS